MIDELPKHTRFEDVEKVCLQFTHSLVSATGARARWRTGHHLARLHARWRRSAGCLYHIHGGGYMLGDAASLEYMHRPMAEKLGRVIVSVDYRLAPETVFPSAIEDCCAGLASVTSHAGELGIDVARIGVTRKSAGGDLSAGLALLVRDCGELNLAVQKLIYR